MPKHYPSLNPKKALIWRIIHYDNLPWILDNGLRSGNSATFAANWVNIGNQELIDKRASHPVPLAPKGVLNDYIPFYFTPFSVMLKNIHSGWGGIEQRANEEIIILVSSLYKIQKQGLSFLFTDSHAYYQWANFYSNLNDLDKVDWTLLQHRDFARDPDDPAKFERYQAEALIHQYCPISALLGIVCYTNNLKSEIEQLLSDRKISLNIVSRQGWYF